MRGTALPASWSVTLEHCTYGAKLGLTVAEVDDLGEAMREWAGANANRAVARKASWDLAFKGWMRRDAWRVIKGRSSKPPTPAAGIPIMPETPEWQSWRDHHERSGNSYSLTCMQTCKADGVPYIARTRLPMETVDAR